MSDAADRRRQKAEHTAEQLLLAAREVFESKGYAATTVGAITEAANTAHGTFYLYFNNKEDAFAKVMAHVAEDLYREATAPWSGDPYEALRIATRGYVEFYAAHRGLWRCLMEGMYQSPALGELWFAVRKPFLDRIEHNLARQRDAGTIRPLDPKMSAAALGSMVEWATFCFVELGEPSGDDVSLEGLSDTLSDLWFTALYGARPVAT